ncbi:MAG: undecaprenyl-diphosphate phosphatase [Oscillospiraceae bacterium]
MDIFEILKTIFLGIVQGITEWLPISSTGHLILVDEFLQLNVSESFKNMFDVVIQFGSILAVVLLYFNKLNPFSSKKNTLEKKDTYSLWLKVAVGCIPAAIIGFLFDDFIDKYCRNGWVIAAMLIIYGVLFIVIENRNKNRKPQISNIGDLTYKTALIIGVFQMLALIPGTSRSGATIVGAILIGIARPVAAEYTFFLAIPTMFGASAVKFIKFIKESGFGMSGNEIILLLIGMIVSFVVSVFAIKFLMGYIKKHDFKVFGWYRIILGVIVLLYFLSKVTIFS